MPHPELPARVADRDGHGKRLYRSTRYGQDLSDCDAVASVGSKGDSYDNALVEALNSLYKAELIRNHHRLDEHGPWEGIDDARVRYHRVGATGRATPGLTPP